MPTLEDEKSKLPGCKECVECGHSVIGRWHISQIHVISHTCARLQKRHIECYAKACDSKKIRRPVVPCSVKDYALLTLRARHMYKDHPMARQCLDEYHRLVFPKLIDESRRYQFGLKMRIDDMKRSQLKLELRGRGIMERGLVSDLRDQLRRYMNGECCTENDGFPPIIRFEGTVPADLSKQWAPAGTGYWTTNRVRYPVCVGHCSREDRLNTRRKRSECLVFGFCRRIENGVNEQMKHRSSHNKRRQLMNVPVVLKQLINTFFGTFSY